MTGTLFGYTISILADTCATKCFVDPKIVTRIHVITSYMPKPLTIKYDNRVECMVEKFLFCSVLELPSFLIEVKFYVAPLGSYNFILGINWISAYKLIVN